MTRAQAKAVFVGGSLISAIFFLALTVDSHRKFAEKTHEERLTPQVVSGKRVWQKYNCNDCHTIIGIGGYYAPDLTTVTGTRDAAWLARFLKNPAGVWPQARQMPNLHMGDQEITDVIAFLDWVSHVDTNGWPPKPLMAASSSPQEPGEGVFKAEGCPACHRIAGQGGTVGPDLTRVGSRRDTGWIEDQIRNPKVHNPASIMPSFARLSAHDVTALATYLAELK